MGKDKSKQIIAIALKLAKQGKIDAAIKEYEKVLQLKPDDLEVRRIIGDLYYKNKNLPEAVKQFYWIAEFYIKEGFLPKAIAMLKRVTKIEPSNETVLFKLAELYSAQGLMIEAKQIYLELADKYKRNQDNKNALRMYEKILEFDSSNTSLRLLLAENYLKEGMEEEATKEYITVADILIRKKEFDKVEELLLKVSSKLKSGKIMEKLANAYIKQKKINEAVNFLKGLGKDIFNHLNLLKLLGDLYFDKGMIKEAEQIYLKISDIKPEEVEVIMKLGRLYIDKKDFEKAFNLFLPVVNKSLSMKKYEDAIALLRLILVANDSYAPVREKMAEIHRFAKKKNSLIQILESLIPIYDKEKNTKKLKETLEELIKLSDTPYEYETRLKELEGKPDSMSYDVSVEISPDDEFMNHNFRKAEDAIRMSDFVEAEKILKMMKEKFPGNINISLKLYDLYEISKNRRLQVEEGLVLYDLYKSAGMYDDSSKWLEKISKLEPNNPRINVLQEGEKTDIDVNFGNSEWREELDGDLDSFKEQSNQSDSDSDIFSLTDEDSVIKPAEDLSRGKSGTVSNISDSGVINLEELTKAGADTGKALDALLSELNFNISSKLFNEAEKLSDELMLNYPGNEKVKEAVKRFNEAKNDNLASNKSYDYDASESGIPEDEFAIDIEAEITDEIHLGNIEENNRQDKKEESGVLIELDDSSLDIQDAHAQKNDELILENENSKSDTGLSEGFLSDVLDDSEPIINEGDTKPPFAEDTPFVDDSVNIFDNIDEDEFLKDAPAFLDTDNYFELAEKAKDEIQAISFWLKELERQRTSTIEKNMMEIFEEFKKGVEDKIGQEDYDTRYNLGIAYKEMGLLEEAIHEFLIASKHPLKLFDSAGLLGICFRTKGMYSESINWFKKALAVPDRQSDEYLNIKYELISCYELSDDLESSKELANEILTIDPDFRDIRKIHKKLMSEK
jgi:tetratricopeptide (TPR) repeat protein